MWPVALLEELGIEHECPHLLIDNQSAFNQIRNNEIGRKSKHVDIKYHFVANTSRKNYSI